MNHDAIDQIISQWQTELPDADTAPLAVLGRISRIEAHVARAISDAFAPFGITRGEFDVLATLRRAGGACQLTPTALMRSVMLSSGAMTNRIDRLEDAGLVERWPDPTDRRGILVTLTSTGHTVVDAALVAGLDAQRELLRPLSEEDQRDVAEHLRTLLLALERDAG